ncbi:MAG TPA: tetratricopeptide repeat protein [Cyclobacteriaceae bacterium]|nr:tetratricopeptide repeat protein [Cyclobacteriaceae bacterium]
MACSPSEEELFQEGIDRLDRQNYTEAVEYMDRVIAINPDHTSAYNVKGVAFFELRNWDKAIEAFDASISIDSTSYKPFFNRGNANLEKKEFTKAIIDYNYASGLDPQIADIYYNRGLALLGLESYEDAIVDFDMALHSNPNQPQVYFNKAKAQLGNNNPMGALESLTNTVNLDQKNDAAFYLLGITQLSALENKEDGCANLKMALSLGYSGAKDWIDKFCGN